MINRIIAAVLSLSILINPVMAQERLTEDPWDLSDAPMQWAPQKKKITVGELELTVWILPTSMMVAPDPGYLLFRSDFGQIKERMDNMAARIATLVGEERAACDIQLREKDASCIRQQAELRTLYDAQVIQIKGLNTSIDDKDDLIFYWQLGTGAAAVLALSFGLFAISK
jgi:hypothetical protein